MSLFQLSVFPIFISWGARLGMYKIERNSMSPSALKWVKGVVDSDD
jgi:hypothetical protein